MEHFAVDVFAKVEKRYNFRMPAIYRSFARRGYFTYPGKSYLWVHEAEWLAPPEMLENGGFFGNPKPGLVAFAFTGGRDLWAWQTQRLSAAGEPMIAFCPRDSFEGWWHAPSLLGWLYRVSLEYAADLWDEESETRRNLRTWASVLREFQQHQWADDLETIAKHMVMSVESGPRGRTKIKALIKKPDVQARIGAAFGDEFVHAPYTWDIDGDPGTLH